jgi:5-methylcytosine-specific restriction endonuclease McrA
MSYKDYTDNDIIEKAKEVKSIAGLLKALNKRVAGGNYDNMKRKLQKLNIDTSHWTGQAWSKDQQLKDWSAYTNIKHARKWLKEACGHSCQECGLKQWQGQQIKLEVDHIDGDRSNNAKSNLKVLCPNCHSLTPTWRKQKHMLH